MPDVRRRVARPEQDEGDEHQQEGDVARPIGRVPDRDHAGAAIDAIAIDDQHEADHRDERIKPAIGPLAHAPDERRARRAVHGEGMYAEKKDETEEEWHERHGRGD